MDDLVVLVDVDHTLLDGALVRARLTECVLDVAGGSGVERFWRHYEASRHELGRVDMPEITARLEADLGLEHDAVLSALERADFTTCLYAGALDALAHLATLGVTVLLSDGDARFQRAKIERAGIVSAVDGRVMVTTHKEQELADVRRSYPAAHYAFLDDRASILAAMKDVMGDEATTVLVRQGRYVDEPVPTDAPPPDLVLASISEACTLTRAALGGAQ